MEGVEWVERRKGHENGRRPFPSLPFPRKKSSATTFPQTNTLYILQGKKKGEEAPDRGCKGEGEKDGECSTN